VPPAGLGAIASADGWFTTAPADPVAGLHDLTGWALDHGVLLEGLEVLRPTLEDVYLALVTDSAPGRPA
jgi:ABC-2 type transport system ATP-binding protein